MSGLAHDAAAFIRRGDLLQLQYLMDNGLGVHEMVPSELGTFTLLQLAAECNRKEIFAFLLDKGADINATGSAPHSCAHLAMENIDWGDELACMAIDAGADLAYVDKEGKSLLHLAGSHKMPLAQAKLLALGLSPALRDAEGRTPLHEAVFGSGALVLALVNAGAEIEARDRRGRTPLQMAAAFSLDETAHTLRALGASIHGVVSPKFMLDRDLVLSPVANAVLTLQPAIVARAVEMYPDYDMSQLRQEIPTLDRDSFRALHDMLRSLAARQQTWRALASAPGQGTSLPCLRHPGT